MSYKTTVWLSCFDPAMVAVMFCVAGLAVAIAGVFVIVNAIESQE